MATLVDGYNLIHASGILVRNIGPGTLQRARDGLVGFLKGSLSEEELSRTTVVFDARCSTSGEAEVASPEGPRVVYALGYPNADALIQELIRNDSAPRQLVVVSSDRQIQQAAKRRRATVVESERWYAELVRRRRAKRATEGQPAEKPDGPASQAEVEYWLEVFGQDP
ncbi:MAG: NYN domain-containing protein [Thermoguttaceae bacterium]